jgi:hypothetical protein
MYRPAAWAVLGAAQPLFQLVAYNTLHIINIITVVSTDLHRRFENHYDISGGDGTTGFGLFAVSRFLMTKVCRESYLALGKDWKRN